MRHGFQRLKTIVDNAAGNRYLVPDLQRDFKWGRERIRSLIATVISGQPIGSLLLVSEISDCAVCETLNRADVPRGNHPYVLDGQLRLIALLAAFRAPRRGRVSEWFERRAGLIWRLDIEEWAECLRRNPGVAVDDPRVIESCIRFRAPGRSKARVSDGSLSGDSRQCLREAREGESFNLPCWYLLSPRGVQSSSAHGSPLEEFLGHFLRHRPDSADQVEAMVPMLKSVPEYKVPIVLLDPCSAATAAEVFRRINQQGEPLALTDLVCSQFSAHDAGLRGKMRSLQRMCDGFGVTSLTALREEDLLRMALIVSRGTSNAAASGIDRLLIRAQNREGVREVRSGVDRLEPALEFAAEVLSECGVADRGAWPLDSVVHALVAAVAAHAAQFRGRQSGVWKRRLKKWWWGETLRQLPMLRRPGPIEVFRRLSNSIGAGEAGDFRMPRSFAEARLGGHMVAERKFPSLRLAIECLLRMQRLEDFSTFREMSVSADGLDLHHIFPKAWARKQRIGGVDCLANLTLMSERTNRFIIRDKGPRELIDELLGGAADARPELYKIMRGHGIEPEAYLEGDFPRFLRHRLAWFDGCLEAIACADA